MIASALQDAAQLYLVPVPQEPREGMEADLIERMPLSIEVLARHR